MTEGPSVTAAAARDPQDAAGAVAQDPASTPQAAAGPAEPAQGSSTTGRQPGQPGWAAQAITGARQARASAERAAAGRAEADEAAAGQAAAGSAADRAQVPPEDGPAPAAVWAAAACSALARARRAPVMAWAAQPG